MKTALAAILLLASAPVHADAFTERQRDEAYENYDRQQTRNSWQRGWSNTDECFRYEYREEYVPGTYHSPGYVKRHRDRVATPCYAQGNQWRHSRTRTPSPDGNECSEGAILGGILGGGAAAALSQGDGRWWAIPLGIVGGSVIGCDIDGG